jgi:hypothetical protein
MRQGTRLSRSVAMLEESLGADEEPLIRRVHALPRSA